MDRSCLQRTRAGSFKMPLASKLQLCIHTQFNVIIVQRVQSTHNSIPQHHFESVHLKVHPNRVSKFMRDTKRKEILVFRTLTTSTRQAACKSQGSTGHVNARHQVDQENPLGWYPGNHSLPWYTKRIYSKTWKVREALRSLVPFQIGRKHAIAARRTSSSGAYLAIRTCASRLHHRQTDL